MFLPFQALNLIPNMAEGKGEEPALRHVGCRTKP